MSWPGAPATAWRVDESSIGRRLVVTPGMCGAGALFFGQVGDWTWEAVGAACRTNVYNAKNADGSPSYLSFYYFHTASTGRLHPYGLTFGDELEVTSGVFDFGSQSVLTLHRIAAAGAAGGDEPLTPEEFYEKPLDDCIYVENLNRWIARGHPDTNQGLVQATPQDLRRDHLPRLPSRYSPRAVIGRARDQAAFHPAGVPGFIDGGEFSTTYAVDVVRDLNGVGLVYFASYFLVVDTALLGVWRELGRADQRFAGRRVLDHRLCYFGNADVGSVFAIATRLWRSATRAGHEIADVVIRDRDTGRLLAVAAVETLDRSAC
ncbi:LnmK family bifunctional acyltransferase/decarboxylase [Kribbella sp. NPDC051718]|uniref:LnmK family bifunctional acyltransferase/decarboxylase n=1 Tax=Kribbella sp. NPDC051718 TaxID=3155168 RepID=UPI00342A52FA